MQLAVAFGASMFSGAGMMKMGLLAATAVGGFMLRRKTTDKQAGKLNDLKVSGSTYGKGIPQIWGTMRVTGNMMWSTDFEEEKHYYSSKGKDKTGKKKDDKKGTPVYEYFANFAMAACEGPVDELLRIWADGNLIYDKYNPGGYTDADGIFHEVVRPGFSQQNGDTGKGGGNKGQKGKGNQGDSNQWSWTWYNGSESQMPDPFMASVNSGNHVARGKGSTYVNQYTPPGTGTAQGRPTPAYRGMAYLFFRKLALKDFGNRTPTITMEVARNRVRMPHFQFFTELTAAQGGIRSWGNPHIKAYVDISRYRLYEEAYPDQNDPHCKVKNSKYLRVYDLTKMTEIAQVAYASMGFINGYVEGFVSAASGYNKGIHVGDFIGINADGNLVFNAQSPANSTPAVIVDGGSYKVMDWFGYWSYVTQVSRLFTNDPIPLLLGAKAMPLASVAFACGMQAVADPNDPQSGADPTSQKAAEYFGGTLLASFKGDTVYLSGGNFFGYPTFVDTPDGQVPTRGAPGLPGIGNATYYIIESYGNFTARLWSGTAAWIQPEFLQPAARLPEKCGIRPIKIFEELPDPTKGDYGVMISDPVTFTGTKQTAVLWARYSHNSSRDGLYMRVYDANDNKFPVVFEKYLPGWPIPDTNVLQQTPVMNSNEISYRAGDWIYVYDVFKRSASRWQLPSGVPRMTGGQAYWSAKGAILHLCVDEDEGGRVKWVMGYLDKLAQSKVTIEEICSDFCDKVGIEPFRVDMSRMVTDEVTGYILENPTSARALVEELAKVYFFDVTESDYSLKFVARGQDPIATIYQDDLGVVEGGGEGNNGGSEKTNEYFKEVKVQEIDCPQRVDVSFINAEKEYENGTQGYQRPRSPVNVLQTREKLDLNMPIAMTPDGAKQMAQKAAMSIWAERITHDLKLPWTYMALDPTDVVTFQMDDGLTFTDRLTKIDVGADLSHEIAAVTQTASTYSSDIKGVRGAGNVAIPKPIEPTVRAEVWDLPLLHDDDADTAKSFQVYWGARAYGDGFRYAALEQRTVGGEWHTVDGTEYDLLWGTVYDDVPAPPNGSWATDDQTKLTLGMGWDFSGLYEWDSISDSNWPSTDNAILIGDELIYFKNVTTNDDGTVTIDTLIRGARGTEAAAYAHNPNEIWTLINLTGFRTIDEPLADLNQPFTFRALSPGLLGFIAPTVRKTLTGASLKPHAATAFTRTDAGADSTVTWKRRTRIAGSLQNGTDTVPLNEEFEGYEAYVLPLPLDYPGVVFDPANPSTYKRAFVGLTTPQFVYTGAQKIADGYSETAGGGVGAHAYWRVRSIAKTMNNNDRAAWAEVKFGLSNNHTSGSASAGTYYNPTDAALAFDGDKTTYWQSYSTPIPGTQWLAYHFAAPVEVRDVQLRLPLDGSYKNVPLQWVIECSDDGVTWTTIITSPAFASYKAGQLITLSVTPPVPEGMHLAVFQMSATVGKGFPSSVTLPPTHLT